MDRQDKERRVRAALGSTLAKTDNAPIRGKVRDIYPRGDELFLVATDRVSAFDRVLGTIPFKGALLTEQACFWLARARQVIDTHLIDRPDPQVMRVRKAEPLPCEIVVRGYLAGSLMREDAKTRGQRYGIQVDPAVADYGKFETPIVTPTTKAAVGEHDQPCSLADLVAGGMKQSELDQCVEAALELFRQGSIFALSQGLILVDTKYEFGIIDGDVVLIDEVHTADSSRYWRAHSYAARLAEHRAPEMLDKERLRQHLLALGYSGDGDAPTLSDDIRTDLGVHYWLLTEQLLGEPFVPPEANPAQRLKNIGL